MFARQSQRGRAPNAVRGGIARDKRSVLFGGARRRRRILLLLIALTLLVAGGTFAIASADGTGGEAESTPVPPPVVEATPEPAAEPAIRWKRSRALGLPFDRGRLVRGVQLPPEGPGWFTYDYPLDASPNRGWRRWGTDRLLRIVFAVMGQYRAADPRAPRLGIADLSRRDGGGFGGRFGGLGHASHQNGLDIDILYPRRDEAELRPARPRQVDRRRAQALVDLFVAAGAEKVFVGPKLNLRGPKRVVAPLIHHDDHLHVRIRPPRRR